MISLQHLETNITMACQNRCVGCNHFVALQKPSMADPDTIAKDLAEFSTIAHAKRYALLGGEPLLHPQLIDIMKIARESGICDEVEVITNGLELHRMTDEFWELIDHLLISVYPNTPKENVELAKSRLSDSNRLEIKNIGKRPFTYPLTSNPGNVFERYKKCWYRTYTFVVDNGYFYRCCMSPFIPELILGLPKETDGISIYGLSDEQLQAYLDSPEVPQSCTACAGHGSKSLGWEQEIDPKEWTRKSTC